MLMAALPQDSSQTPWMLATAAGAGVVAAAAQASKQAHTATHQPTHLTEHHKALLDHTLKIILVKPPAGDTHTAW
jgi:hypothetical protein